MLQAGLRGVTRVSSTLTRGSRDTVKRSPTPTAPISITPTTTTTTVLSTRPFSTIHPSHTHHIRRLITSTTNNCTRSSPPSSSYLHPRWFSTNSNDDQPTNNDTTQPPLSTDDPSINETTDADESIKQDENKSVDENVTAKTSITLPSPAHESKRAAGSSSMSTLGLLSPYELTNRGDSKANYYPTLEAFKTMRTGLLRYAQLQMQQVVQHASAANRNTAQQHASGEEAIPPPPPVIEKDQTPYLIAPLLPYHCPLLPGMKTELRIARSEIQTFLAHLKLNPTEIPKYIGLFYKKPIPSRYEKLTAATAELKTSLNQLTKLLDNSPLKNVMEDPRVKELYEKERLKDIEAAAKEKRSTSTRSIRKKSVESLKAKTAAKASKRSSKTKFEEAVPPTETTVDQIDVPITIPEPTTTQPTSSDAVSSPTIELTPEKRAELRQQVADRVKGLRGSLDAIEPSMKSIDDATHNQLIPIANSPPPMKRLKSIPPEDTLTDLDLLLNQTHEVGVICELQGIYDDLSKTFQPLNEQSVRTLTTTAPTDSDLDQIILRVIVLDRCSVDEVIPTDFLLAKLKLLPEPSFISEFRQGHLRLKNSPQDPEAQARSAELKELEHRAKELYKIVTAFLKLRHEEEQYQRTHGALPTNASRTSNVHSVLPAFFDRRSPATFKSQQLWAYDLTRPTSIADHALSLCFASLKSLEVQKVLSELDSLKRVNMVEAILSNELALLQSQMKIRQTLDESEGGKERLLLGLLEQQKTKILQQQSELEEQATSTLVPSTTTDESKKSEEDSATWVPPKTRKPHRTPKEQTIDKFRARLQGKIVPAEVEGILEDEFSKYMGIDSENSSSAHMSKHYLDWMTCLPWGITTPEFLNLKEADAILEREHHGMRDVKNQILEIIAVGLMKKKMRDAALPASLTTPMPATPTSTPTTSSSAQSAPASITSHAGGKILCLIGPPGTGKTSIGRSVANALHRSFHRISVGGLDDVSEIKGHRRTYMGALPGCIVRALKHTQVSDPVILLDEIDKLGSKGWRGEPSAALLEVLDPEQNSSFIDHFLDCSLDLSRVLFICTANNVEGIPGPLRDRMEFIQVSGYTAREKMSIAMKYLIPALYKSTGVQPHELTIREEAVEDLIRWYAREPGVRSLQKHLEKLFRKVAFTLAKKRGKPTPVVVDTTTTTATAASVPVASDAAAAGPIVTIDPSNLHEYVGQRKYARDRMYETTPVGVVMGLGYSDHGGSTIFIESTFADSHHTVPEIPSASALLPSGEPVIEKATPPPFLSGIPPSEGGRGGFFCTGQLGSVMKESSSIAYTVAKRYLARYAPSRINAFQSQMIHIHLPHGSTPKDGPSAGITLTTSLLSLAFQTPVTPDLAMTGELTLTGQVTAIGGLKEKLLAAKRARVTAVIVPHSNRAEIHEISEQAPELLEELQIHFVKTFDDIMPIVFPHLQKEVFASPDLSQTVETDSETITQP